VTELTDPSPTDDSTKSSTLPKLDVNIAFPKWPRCAGFRRQGTFFLIAATGGRLCQSSQIQENGTSWSIVRFVGNPFHWRRRLHQTRCLTHLNIGRSPTWPARIVAM